MNSCYNGLHFLFFIQDTSVGEPGLDVCYMLQAASKKKWNSEKCGGHTQYGTISNIVQKILIWVLLSDNLICIG